MGTFRPVMTNTSGWMSCLSLYCLLLLLTALAVSVGFFALVHSSFAGQVTAAMTPWIIK